MPFERRWFKAAEVAERLGCSRKSVYNAVSAGRIPAAKAPGIGLRIDMPALEAQLAQDSARRASRSVGRPSRKSRRKE